MKPILHSNRYTDFMKSINSNTSNISVVESNILVVEDGILP